MGSNADKSMPVVFSTQTPYALPPQKFMIPTTWKRYQLSQLVNKALSLDKPVPFDFLVQGEILRVSLGEWCAEKAVGEEETLQIEYIESIMPPQQMSSLPHEDWVSAVSLAIPSHFLTGGYDGVVRAFDYSQTQVAASVIHTGAITSLTFVPAQSSDQSHLLLTGSLDLTAKLSKITLSASAEAPSNISELASLHLHTAPISSVAAASSGQTLLTASWDGLIGVWDTSIPTHDEVADPNTQESKKKRKVVRESQAKRKAPIGVLKSHTARVSKVVFGNTNDAGNAYSCGMDSTIRVWDVENGLCTRTITASEKPMLDLALTASGSTALAASTDRTVSMYDLRASDTATTLSSGSLTHPATPSCIVASPTQENQIATGAYDGVVRVWDLRSMKSPIASFKATRDAKKVLALDWIGGIITAGGEGGLEVWKFADNTTV